MAITPYGLNPRYHQATEISDRLLKSSDKWAERLRIYANYVTPDGKLGRSLNDDLAKDRSGIAYIAAPTRSLAAEGASRIQPALKLLEVAAGPEGPYVPYTIDTLRDRSYPLYDEIFAYLERVPGRSLDPKVEEYIRFVLSREGQAEVMRDGKYLPLTAKVVREQLEKLE
jgi:phosphate transport system substrate-binding protein